MVTNYYPYNSSRNVYRNMPSYRGNQVNYPNEQRGLFFPFVVGGLAGTALGYGIANNNYNRYIISHTIINLITHHIK